MSRNQVKGLLCLGITSITYVLIVYNRVYTVYSYAVLLFLMFCTIYITNNKKILSANLLFFAYFCYTVGFGPLILLYRGKEYSFDYFTIILGGLLFFCLGNIVAVNNKKVKVVKDKVRLRFNIKRVWILRILYLISLLATVYYLYKNGALLMSDVNGNRVEAQSGSGILLYASQLSVLIVPMMYDLFFYGKRNGVKIVSGKEVVFLAIISVVILMASGYRAPVFSMLICLAVLYMQKNNIKSGAIIAIGLFLIISVELLGNIRYVISGTVSTISLMNTLSTSLIGNCINLNYVFRAFPQNISFQYGYTYLINLLMLLPGPDQDFTLWLKEQLNLSFSGGGVTPTILGEFYINFGNIGIYIGMFFVGIAGVYINRYFQRHSKTFLGVFYVWQFAHCASGGVANVMIVVIIYTIVYWGLMMFPEEMNLERKI